jgi:general secretion pathway protein G
MEIMVVLAILALLTSLLVVNYAGIFSSAKHKIAVQEMAKIVELVEQYRILTGDYPSQDDGLAALTKPLPNQTEPLAKGRILDPWGHPYIYVYPGQHGKYDITSLGADGAEGGDGENADIHSWDDQATTLPGS